MKKLDLQPQLVYRVPVFPVTARLEDHWEELKQAIGESSFDFFELIKGTGSEQLSQLSPGTLHTIWKYFNRSRYRATPFGSFAGFGLARIHSVHPDHGIVIADRQQLHLLEDWSKTAGLEFSAKELEREDQYLFANSSYYQISDVIRFVRPIPQSFELSEIEAEKDILALLHFTKLPRRFSEVKQYFVPAVKQPYFYALVDHLLSAALLISGKHPNIIGQDYFERARPSIQPGGKPYIIARRSAVQGGFSKHIFQHIPALLEILSRIVPDTDNPRLNDFVSRFTQKFEQAQVPLMQAMDPEIGVGYDGLEHAGDPEDFIAELLSRKPDTPSGNLVKNFLIRSMIGMAGNQSATIDLNDLAALFPESPAVKLPNSLSFRCYLDGQTVIMDQAGGCTATALLGRFTLADDELLGFCRQLTEIEQQANPDVLFFDVSYMSEGYIDNVNRRKAIYELQLSILNFDTSAAPITLDDLYLSHNGHALVLWSRTYNKRMVPRLASSYNYLRSDLPVYRLLCDLQNQGLKTSLTFDPRSFVVDLDYYPQIRFKNIIVSPRYWKLRYQDYVYSEEPFGVYLTKRVPAILVKAGQGDRTLCFDLSNHQEVNFLLAELKAAKALFLSEVNLDEPLVKDQAGRSYAAEYILSLTHHEQIYSGFESFESAAQPRAIQQLFPPCDQWLYFELFCHAGRMDTLLTGSIQQYLLKHHKSISDWFFIRYAQGGEHLRLRLRMHRSDQSYKLIKGLNTFLQKEIHSGLISDIRLRTYRREIGRYGAEVIQAVERHFCVDSSFVIQALELNLSVMERYQLCIALAAVVLDSGIFGNESRRRLITKLYDSYAREFAFGSDQYKILNRQYQRFKADAEVQVHAGLQYSFQEFSQSFIQTLAQCGAMRRPKLFGDLMHMHINRLFDQNQRLHEAVIYYFLNKEQLRVQALATPACQRA